MGFLLDLIRRWTGTKPPGAPPESAPGAAPAATRESIAVEPPPAPTPAPEASAISAPEAVAEAPGPAPSEPMPTAPVEVAPAPPAPAAPEPLGLPDDLQSPLRGDWGAIDAGSGSDAPSEPSPAPGPVRSTRREAADRRRERAAAVAERHATDIRYLGRGVSEGLSDRRGDRAKLEALGLPIFASPADLADRLGITVPRLRWLAFHEEVASRVHYVAFEVAKKGGGTRRLSAPHRSLDLAQGWIAREVVARLPVSDQAHGFVPGRSILTNARAHAGRAVVANLDLADFFPSIGWRRVRRVFERAGYSPAVATVLALVCTEAPRRTVQFDGETLHVATGPRGLPQGARTSPGLANQVARGLDARLAGLAGRLGAVYTRYADDLTFSGGPDLDPRIGALLAAVRRIAASEGFAVNPAKTRVLRRNAAQVVTGLVVNDRPGVARGEVRRLRAILHRAQAEGLDAQNRAGHPDFRAHLRGKIAFIAMARPAVGARLLAALQAVEGG